MAGLSDLCFDPGKAVDALVSQRFGRTVSSPPSPSSFVLVVSFGRSAIRLNEDSVSLLLQASIGGVAKEFCVSHLSGWMFKFVVSCKEVGFLIYKLKQFTCKQYSIFFFLWGKGGPNWRRDYALWCQEQEAEWTTVGAKKSYADAVRSRKISHQTKPGPSKSVFSRLSFPDNYHQNYFIPQRTLAARSWKPTPKPSGQRVLRWVPKIQRLGAAIVGREKLAGSAFGNNGSNVSNSNSDLIRPPPE